MKSGEMWRDSGAIALSLCETDGATMPEPEYLSVSISILLELEMK